MGWIWLSYNKDLGIESDNYDAYRSDPRLIAAIEKIGEVESSRKLAHIKIVEIPDDVAWEISDYDGIETIHEAHRIW